ncbi:protein of unknown function [Pseudosulfitobacter pseudonitzschiae]|uniref:Membrane protein n=1 Tax=Pseudosulfitobacter pseudonitzschiae TaxID=1402135 RepID=A0A073J1R6_9RHOB|nr:DUF1206 domain-containing protein [Pseudosulfitobacter pseudonitzschiae]KEJ95795.1 membrane protein [Pseudosulfitobacter pseudonitzschiae]SHF68598.1 protein of unknown function [Pseudosulfitobacter pseudonitzschiae]
MADAAHQGTKWIMRAGYGARGVIYIIVGGLALTAALRGGDAKGTKDALATLQNEPMGLTTLWCIAAGLGAYMIWRLVDAVLDLEDHGTDLKGIFARFCTAATGVIHGAIGVSVAGLARGGAADSGGARDWTAQVMQMPMGPYLVAFVAAVFLGAGIYYAHKGLTGSYRTHLSTAPFTQRAQPVLTFGLVVHGAMLALVGVSLGFAAWHTDPSDAGGIGQALETLRALAWGRFLLAGAGLGLLGFAVYNLVEAVYRVIPHISGPNVPTLADQTA